METQIYEQQKTIHMNKFINCVISVTGGGGTAIITWERLCDLGISVFCGIMVTVASGIMLHYLLPHIPKLDWGKKKNDKSDKSN